MYHFHQHIMNITFSKWVKGFMPFLLCVGLTACSLDENPKDQIEEEKVYTSQDALFQHTVATLYSYVGGNTDGQGLQGTCRGVYDLQTFGSDEALLPTRGVDWYDGGIWQNMYKHSWNAGHELVNKSWNYLYKVITLCNRSLEVIENHKDLLTRMQKDRFTSEVRGLRAIYYFYLLDLFGNVPIVTSTDVSMNEVKQSTRSEVFRFVEKELVEVVPYLLNQAHFYLSEGYGRINIAVALFVLAKLYLNAEIYADDDWTDGKNLDGKNIQCNFLGEKMNAWEACIKCCDLIGQLGYSLEKQYEDCFAIDNHNSHEIIWYIPMDKYRYANQQQNMYRSYHYRHAASFGFSGENGTSASLTVLKVNKYQQKDEDKRFRINYWSDDVTDLNGWSVMDRVGNKFNYAPWEVDMDVSNSKFIETAGARMKKYEVDKNALLDGKLMDNDIVLFRYADVLLMMAEAKMRNGESGQKELDMVRTRANMNLVEATFDNLYDERLIELAWEGWRRNDMVRFRRYKSTYEGAFSVNENDGHTTVFPIPGDMITLNPNFKQNPGY